MDQARTKVLLLLHDLSPTGAPKVALSAFEHLRDRVDLWTITYQGGPLGEQFARLGRLQTLVSYAWPGMPAAPQALLRFLLHRTLSLSKGRLWSHRLRRWQPDLIYINSVVGLLAAKRLQLPPVPILLHVHEMDSFLRVLTADAPELVLGLPDRYIAVSEAVTEALTMRFGVDPAKVAVVPAFVDPDLIPLPPPREPHPDRPFVVGGAGVISWVKGPQLWLLMAAEVKRRLGAGHVRFVWVGVPDNDDGWQFREMARKLKLTEDLDCISFTSSPLDFYADFDVFALTSWGRNRVAGPDGEHAAGNPRAVLCRNRRAARVCGRRRDCPGGVFSQSNGRRGVRSGRRPSAPPRTGAGRTAARFGQFHHRPAGSPAVGRNDAIVP